MAYTLILPRPQTYQLWLDRSSTHTAARWISTVVLIICFGARIVLAQVGSFFYLTKTKAQFTFVCSPLPSPSISLDMACMINVFLGLVHRHICASDLSSESVACVPHPQDRPCHDGDGGRWRWVLPIFLTLFILDFCSWRWSQKISELLLFPDGPSGLPTSQNEEFRPFIRWNSTPKTKTQCSSMFCPGACQSSNSGTRRPRPRWLLSYIIALLCHTYFHLVILSLFPNVPPSFIPMIKFN